MSDIIVDYGSLPDDIREKLAELELELSEGKEPESNPQPSEKSPSSEGSLAKSQTDR